MPDIAAQERESQLRKMERTVMENIAMTDKARWSQAKIAKYKKWPSWMRVAMVLFCFPFMLFFWIAQDGEAIIDSFSEQ